MSGNQGMEQLIPIVNKLQDVFSQLGVNMQLGKCGDNENESLESVQISIEVYQIYRYFICVLRK